MTKLYENIIKAIEEWLETLHSNYGISPGTTLVLFAILLVLLVLIIANAKRHKKLQKMAEQNQSAAFYLKANMDEVIEGMASIEESIAEVGGKLDEIEKKKVDEASRTSQQAQTPNTAQPQNPSIIYIDNRQGAANTLQRDEILENIGRASNSKSFGEKQIKENESENNPFSKDLKHEPLEVRETSEVHEPLEENSFFDFDYDYDNPQNAKTEPRAIYTDRTSGVSKSGKEYTLEQLQKQIKD